MLGLLAEEVAKVDGNEDFYKLDFEYLTTRFRITFPARLCLTVSPLNIRFIKLGPTGRNL